MTDSPDAQILPMSITETLLSKYKSRAANVGDKAMQSALENELHDDHGGEEGESFLKLTASLVDSTVRNAWSWLRGKPMDFTEHEKVESLLLQKKTATSYQAWLRASEELDTLQNFDKWKDQKESSLYDYKLIEKNLHELREARISGDARKLLYLIRTTWTRNIGNIGNVNLYRHSHTGTKHLIEEYLEECELALETLTKEGAHDIDDRYTLSMLTQTRKNIGRTALLLSGGGGFGLFHIGVLAALLEEDVLPRIISGSSAGAIVASILCVHNKDEIVDLISTIVDRKFDIFDDTSKKEGIILCLSRFLKYGTWFDSENLKQTMIDFLGQLTFREAFYRTGKILNIPVSPASVHEHPRLLNYLTAPSVLIWSAVCASCSLPGVFPSSTIYEKNPKTGVTQEWHHQSVKFVDGSVDNDLPITRLSEMFNVDHIIACQVNPHVVPFLKLSVTCVGGEIETEYSARLKTKLGQLYEIWAAEATHYLQMSAEVGISRNLCTKLRSVLSQQYSGDITILPELKEVMRLDKILTNPTPEFLLHCTMKGARATWPKISIIKNHCNLEFALDRAIKALKGRNFKDMNSTLALVNSPSLAPEEDNQKMNQTGNSKSAPQADFRQSMMKKNHHRRRSETISIGRMKNLRPVKSTVSVRPTDPSTPRYQPSSPVAVARYHRSYSASNQETGSFFTPQNYSLLTPESSQESYFRPHTANSPIKNSRSSAHISRKDSFTVSNSSSSEKLFINATKKTCYNNIDGSDGLFDSPREPLPSTNADFGSDESLADNVKDNEYSGSDQSQK